MKAIQSYHRTTNALEKGRDLPLLLFRLILAYGFYEPAKMKWSDMNSIIQWFGSAKFPVPALSAYLVAISEGAGVVLLALGLFTRFITVPLMIIMLVAIFAVHWSAGFAASDNGFEIPLYYLLMLFALFIMGPGRISLDHWLRKKYGN
ncbi:HvfX family Cu-binding RiPP maturation protein [Chitinophaga japonensis]|uniref:Putative oxidoreductase n=1 Tax=Chitinophaga japonensis TaxID=104662 RepID=A0A562SME4_CHIJA|nr:DoxX family protein [Chitinophaga japonensis]TWI82479.1 putative oxidoreductase [Chitinophaga japonensis]